MLTGMMQLTIPCRILEFTLKFRADMFRLNERFLQPFDPAVKFFLR